MTAPAPWSVKGIDPRAREVAKDLARRSGMTLGEWLNRMIVEQDGQPAEAAPGRYAYAQPEEPIPLEPSVRGLLGRVERNEREQVAVAARFEQLAEELRTDQMRLAERLRRMEHETDQAGVGDALHALEQTIGRLASHVYGGEGRTSDAIRDLGACFVKLDGRLRQVEGRGGVIAGDASVGEALEDLRADIAGIADNFERKLFRADAIQAQSLEKLGDEMARITERLTEKIDNAERRAAMAADEVSEQVSRVAERIHQRQERAADDVTERFRQVEERTARLLEDMRANIEASFAAARMAPLTEAVTAGPLPPHAFGEMEASLSESRAIDADLPPLLTTREVIDQARARSRSEAEPETRDAGFGFMPGRKLTVKKRPSSTTLQTALFVTGTAAALGAGVASYMLGVAEPASQVVEAEPVATTPAAAAPKGEARVAVALGPQAITPKSATSGLAAGYAEAVRKLKAKEPGGLAELKKAAEAGLPAAQFHLARLYESGDGVRKDETEARRWTEQAARGGDAKAMHNLALYYFEGAGGPKDTAGAAQWFRRAAEKGVTDSQFNLGRLYEEGYGVPKDPAAAYRWYAAAATSGDAEAKAAADRMRALVPAPAQ